MKKTSAKKPDADNVSLIEGALARLADGENDALAVIYGACRTSVYGFALSILKNSYDAEDVMQETFVKVFSEADRYRPQGKPMAWILTITRNLCLHRLRKTSRLLENEEDWDRHADSAAEGERLLDGIVLREAMTALSDEERQIVVLHALSDMKHRQIAEVMGIPLPTVLSKYSRAMKKLRNRLQGED
mgnify:CR=1 FL=1